jgi:predicted RNase H-like nuclease (RuvC/YqgF family)
VSVENQTRTTDDHDEDVIIIEEKSKTSHWVAGVTLIIGAIAGGLIGSSVSDNKWSEAYAQLEVKAKQYQAELKQADVKSAELDVLIATEKEQALEEQKKVNAEDKAQAIAVEAKKRTSITKEVGALKSHNASLGMQVEEQDKQITQLTNQVDLQLTMLSRAKQLFQRQLQIKEEASALQVKVEVTTANEKQLAKECKVYLEGKSWDVKSDVCKRQEEAKNLITQYNDELQLLQMDIKEIDRISEDLGM